MPCPYSGGSCFTCRGEACLALVLGAADVTALRCMMGNTKLKNPERCSRSRDTSDRRKNLRPVWQAKRVRAGTGRLMRCSTIATTQAHSRTPPDKHGQKEVFPKGSVVAVFLLLFLKKK